jgi:hypothetical protein
VMIADVAALAATSAPTAVTRPDVFIHRSTTTHPAAR